jgi:hypothetical protein
MREGRQKKQAAASLRIPQPKKLGLSVPPLLRLPHQDLIRPDSPTDEQSAQSVGERKSSSDEREESVQASQAEIASLAKSEALALQNASLANAARLAKPARLSSKGNVVSLMDSLPESAGFTKLHHQVVDYLYSQLSAKEQIVHLQLYRLSWGTGHSNCFISLPKLARRSNLSQRSAAEATALLEIKGLIRKGAVVVGKGKDQGIEYWVTPARSLAKSASLANPASHAPVARHAETEQRIEYKEEIHEEHTHKETRVGVSSRFTLAECRRFADHLRKTGQGIANPGGYATTIHRTGEADTLIEAFLHPPPTRDLSHCPECSGQGYRLVIRDGQEGVVKCRHDRLEQPGSVAEQ